MGRFSDLFAEADAAFNGLHKEELEGLKALSKIEIEELAGSVDGIKIHSDMIKVIESATKENRSKAQLVGDIKSLGDVAIKIASKVPGLVTIL